MIKAQELRLGNLFFGMSMVQTVFEIVDNTDRGKYNQAGYEHLILCKENGNQYKPIECEPIPITENRLLMLGFEQLNRDVPGFEKGNLIVEWLFERWTARLYYDCDTSIQIIVLDSIHQLQNIFYALNGKELVAEPTRITTG